MTTSTYPEWLVWVHLPGEKDKGGSGCWVATVIHDSINLEYHRIQAGRFSQDEAERIALELNHSGYCTAEVIQDE